MHLSLHVSSEFFEMTAAAPTVVEPGEEMAVTIELRALARLTIGQISWTIPDNLTLALAGEPPAFPVSLEEGATWRFEQLFAAAPGKEGYGELAGELIYHPDGSEVRSLDWKHWISIFGKVTADETAPLSDELRDRLLGVTNARPRNGHIFLADHVRYFADYLNIVIPERLAAILARDFGLADQGLPVDEEQYILFCQGLRTFYGIEVLELIAEEHCNESDDRFDPDELREVIHPDVELNA
jgi:hypothetical protein